MFMLQNVIQAINKHIRIKMTMFESNSIFNRAISDEWHHTRVVRGPKSSGAAWLWCSNLQEGKEFIAGVLHPMTVSVNR